MRFYLLDSAMMAPHGHHDHFARGFLASARGYDCEPVVCAHRKVSASLQEELGARPTFASSMYHPASSDLYDGGLTDFRMRTRQFSQDLDALKGAVADEDVILLPTAVAAEIHGLGVWLQANGVKPKVAAFFHRAEPEPLTPGGLTPALLRTAARTLSQARPSGLWVGATNQRLGDALAPILGRPLEVAPSVTFYGEAPVAAPRSGGDTPLRVGFLGSARGEKGYDVIPGLILAAGAADLPMRFWVQCHGADRALESYRPLKDEPRVELIRNWLTEEDMVRLVDSLDIVAMPYDRSRYANMVSGVFTLAVGYGKPALVPSGTWMADQIAAGDAVGVVYEGEDAASALAALQRMAADLPALSRRAVEAAPRWRERFSGETMVHNLMRWAGAARRPSARPAEPARAGTAP